MDEDRTMGVRDLKMLFFERGMMGPSFNRDVLPVRLTNFWDCIIAVSCMR
jgi:hypothetical protein